MANGKHIVICGQSASGKTTLVNYLAKKYSCPIVPEHVDWIGGSKNFPKSPNTIVEKKAKQKFFFDLDVERYNWTKNELEHSPLVISDADFTSPLAHNYAERWFYPELDVYGWMVETYSELLRKKILAPADAYVYLDVSLEQRIVRRKSEMNNRKRNDVFFKEPFPSNMRQFYFLLMNSGSTKKAVTSTWIKYDGLLNDSNELICDFIGRQMHSGDTKVQAEALIRILEGTILDQSVNLE
ncbi:MAG: hypothetical protein A2504_00485 [Bdellovibrionales bacterium RIFOXYD12_FULL_39_22]|nr:MAG: hypothetical protein A2385_14770 [Bdellovibrionales bacterium RIFOXYB1_FULL_39_21]OFZ43997.1 MAG: hypothetical protein A2485_12405 [Bdellovibrionales bacterium RIFOXYC12_FULL_39_17]OFZ47786.1 MAG: hypothetical protein A2404_14230 [Bdellovibrionales bacterium RIFOXYC1_FULL_39_130]OFZ76477.1 MAG: hypothetical protein A2560_17630 [Bdellovibrionales bacterium RIFOXYD1_FULL_39_84]OFZ95155.1 MAG: hypothetical protein A2504_00485 [Bdellovibrionales bacterium RIFOXYD12_FULL_39_22]HLE11655.1 hy